MQDLVAERAARLHPGREPSDPPIPGLPPPHQSIPAESFGRRYGWLVTVITGAFGLGVTVATFVFAWQVASLKEQLTKVHEKLDRLETKIEVGFSGEATSRNTLTERVARIEGAMSKTPGLSTSLNVANHEIKP